jgi:hypothetical protein
MINNTPQNAPQHNNAAPSAIMLSVELSLLC